MMMNKWEIKKNLEQVKVKMNYVERMFNQEVVRMAWVKRWLRWRRRSMRKERKGEKVWDWLYRRR